MNTTDSAENIISEVADRGCDVWIKYSLFPHAIDGLQTVETHISHVLLTGPYAYKIKKAVDFGFVDYTTLEKRRKFCELEIQLNRRFAPELYLGVVPIYATADGFCFGDLLSEPASEPHPDSQIVDYAVKMRQFPQDAILANRLNDPELTSEIVEQFGQSLARTHLQIEPVAKNLPMGNAAQIVQDALDNFLVLYRAFRHDPRVHRLDLLKKWTCEWVGRLRSKFQARRDRGCVKPCHGDLHLKNIIQWHGKLVAFDGIEFNEQLQCTDVLSEIAFPVMDFMARGRADLGWRLLNAYLEAAGDYDDLDILRFYLVYRAMVRAKVGWLNPKNRPPGWSHLANQPTIPLAEVETDQRNCGKLTAPETSSLAEMAGPWDKYFAAAELLAFEIQPTLAITHGFSGSGKSTIALQAIDVEGGIRVRSDSLREQLASREGTTDKYSETMNTRVYNKLKEIASAGTLAGFPIIADATFLRRTDRQQFLELVGKLNIPFQIIDCNAPYDELCRRIQQRGHCDPSEATIEILRHQIAHHDPLDAHERQYVRFVHNSKQKLDHAARDQEF